MTDTADRSDNSVEPAQDDQPQAPEEAAQALSTEPLEMPEPGSAPAGFRFPSDAEPTRRTPISYAVFCLKKKKPCLI